MTTVFDPLRMSAVSLDVMAVNRDSAQGVARRQQARLALLLDAVRITDILPAAGAQAPTSPLPVQVPRTGPKRVEALGGLEEADGGTFTVNGVQPGDKTACRP